MYFLLSGHLSIADVKSPDVLKVVKPLIEKLQLDSAHRIRAEISEIFAFAIVLGIVEYDPAQAVAPPCVRSPHVKLPIEQQ
jgi:site-specific recombinase XerD